MKRRIVAFLLALTILLPMLPVAVSIETLAANSYNVEAAINYAATNYGNYPGTARCSEFVMDCLWTGGLKDVYGTQGSSASTLSAAKSGKNKDTGTLYRYLKSKGFAVEYYYASNGKLATIEGQSGNYYTSIQAKGVAQKGDCIFYFGDNESNPQHFVICSKNGGSNGFDQIYSVTPMLNSSVKGYGPGLHSDGSRVVRYIGVFHLNGTTGGTATTPNANMSASEYLAGYATVTPLSTNARTKNGSNIQAWKLPWTDNSNSSLKYSTVSGSIKIINKIVNHAGNTWYEYDTGASTRAFVYSSDITLLPYPSGAGVKNIGSNTATIYVTWKNPGALTLIKGGFTLMTSSGAILKTVTETVPSSYQTAAAVPCSYEMKTEYQYALQPNTTYTYSMFIMEKSGAAYETTGKFTTSKVPVSSVAISPTSKTLEVGSTVQLSASVAPSNASKKTVTWTSSNSAVATVSSGGLVTAKTKGSATITAKAADGSGKYATSAITVVCNHLSGFPNYVCPGCGAKSVRITEYPVPVTVKKGETASVSVAATGDGLTYQWYIKKANAGSFSPASGFTGNSFSVTMTEDYDGCQVYCAIKDRYGNGSETEKVTLTMAASTTPLQILSNPQDITTEAGEVVTLSVEAIGDGLTYGWYYLPPDYSGFNYVDGSTGSSYSFTVTEDMDGGGFFCEVNDKHGNSIDSEIAFLTVKTPLKITKQPQSVTVAEGATAKVSLTATGDGLIYRWYYKNAGDSSYTYTSSFRSNTYSVTMNEARNGRRVLCKVYDKYGNMVQSNSVLLNMKQTAQTVKITSHPTSVTVAEGATAKVTVKATGDGLSYRWYYKDAGSSSYKYTASFKGNTYSVTMNEARNGRRVLCKVYDQYGNMAQSNSALLKMKEPTKNTVKIITQPTSVTVAEGATAKVTVKATGDGLTYKWYFKNANASSFSYTASFTGNSYYITMNNERNGRLVYCKITDKYGNTATTNTVSLSMPSSWYVGTEDITYPMQNGERAKWTISLSGASNQDLTYQWYFKDVGSSSFKLTKTFTDNYYIIDMTPERDGRQVYCKITDQSGHSQKSGVTTFVMTD